MDKQRQLNKGWRLKTSLTCSEGILHPATTKNSSLSHLISRVHPPPSGQRSVDLDSVPAASDAHSATRYGPTSARGPTTGLNSTQSSTLQSLNQPVAFARFYLSGDFCNHGLHNNVPLTNTEFEMGSLPEGRLKTVSVCSASSLGLASPCPKDETTMCNPDGRRNGT